MQFKYMDSWEKAGVSLPFRPFGTISLPGGVRHMSASDVSPPFHRLFHPPPDTCRWPVVWLFCFVCGVCVFWLFSCFASVRGFLPFLRE